MYIFPFLTSRRIFGVVNFLPHNGRFKCHVGTAGFPGFLKRRARESNNITPTRNPKYLDNRYKLPPHNSESRVKVTELENDKLNLEAFLLISTVNFLSTYKYENFVTGSQISPPVSTTECVSLI
jgi:hypothetical protein